jgi:23S rRNA (uracil1939-C5)-methyltransferase
MAGNMKIGDIVNVSITSVAFGGEGVGRIDDLVVFVPFTVTGDEVEVEIISMKRRFVRGRIKRIVVPSGSRVEPPCPYYTDCGGCQYQHIRYEAQTDIKQIQIGDAFRRIGMIGEPPLNNIIPSPHPFFYRGKAEFQIQVKGGKLPVAGFMHAASNEVVDVESCLLVDETINLAYREFREKLPAGHHGYRNGSKKLIWSYYEDYSVDSLTSSERSEKHVERLVKGKRFLVPRRGFFQANLFLLDCLVENVVSLCGLTGKETVLDAYCGSGLFSAFIAERSQRLFGIETDAGAVWCARENLRRLGYDNATIFRGDVSQVMRDRLLRQGIHVDVIVLDPPRLGLDGDTASAVAEIEPKKIVYVSCNPATQARDARVLTNKGYRLVSLQPMDMFPHTAHVEVIGLFEKEITRDTI